MHTIQHSIDEAKTLNHEIEIISQVKSGKEATVYRILLDGELSALKVYKNPQERSFKKTGQYLAGKFYKRASERKAIAKGNAFGKKIKHDNWVKREFFMLEKLYDLGAQIPEPFLYLESAIVMEFLGTRDEVASRLIDIDLSPAVAPQALSSIIDTVHIFWNFGIVHADLSAYNILWWKNSPYIIDFPQSIDTRLHPHPLELLERDVKNVLKYFSTYTTVDCDKIWNEFISSPDFSLFYERKI